MSTLYTKNEAIEALCRLAYDTGKSKGWYEEPRTFGDRIALMHSELSEALEEFRKPSASMLYYQESKPEGILAELADVVIRIFDYAGSENQSEEFSRALIDKMLYNLTRPHRHGGKRL